MFKTIYKKVLVGIVALAIIVGGGYYLMPTKTEPPIEPPVDITEDIPEDMPIVEEEPYVLTPAELKELRIKETDRWVIAFNNNIEADEWSINALDYSIRLALANGENCSLLIAEMKSSQDQITINKKCIVETIRYRNYGTPFSTDVIEWLHLLNMISYVKYDSWLKALPNDTL